MHEVFDNQLFLSYPDIANVRHPSSPPVIITACVGKKPLFTCSMLGPSNTD
jgi:hypothetical protein